MKNGQLRSFLFYQILHLRPICFWVNFPFKLGDNGCMIHSVSDDGNRWIVTKERYVVMPWKMVTRNGTNMTLAEAVDGIWNRQESEAKELEIRNRE